MFRVVWNPYCFYFAVLDERGQEVYGAMSIDDAESWLRNHCGNE